jgi:hypothetical protein
MADASVFKKKVEPPTIDDWYEKPASEWGKELERQLRLTPARRPFADMIAEIMKAYQAGVISAKNKEKKPSIDPEIERVFRALADKWIKETGYLSDPIKKFMHPSHLKIIGMGEKVLPLILREAQKRSGHWFVALNAISPENPVKPEDETSLERVANAWLEWGKERDLV